MQPTNHPSPVDQIARALLVAMLCAAPALVCFRTAAGACVADADLGWHLRTGERQYTGALYTPWAWGGFLIWNLRQPVSIDGRAAFYGDQRIDRSRRTWNGAPDWSSDPDLESAGVVIAPG